MSTFVAIEYDDPHKVRLALAKLQREYFASPEAVLQRVGVGADVQMEQDADEEVECSICFDDVPPQRASALQCGHKLCNECWVDYLRTNLEVGNE